MLDARTIMKTNLQRTFITIIKHFIRAQFIYKNGKRRFRKQKYTIFASPKITGSRRIIIKRFRAT